MVDVRAHRSLHIKGSAGDVRGSGYALDLEHLFEASIISILRLANHVAALFACPVFDGYRLAVRT